MKRRDAIRTIGAAALAPLAVSAIAAEQGDHKAGVTGKVKSSPQKLVLGDGFFLSMTNPIATVDQRDMEVMTLQMLQLPEIRAAKALAAQRFKILIGPDIPEEALRNFDEVMEEWAVHYLQLAINGDSNYPKVLHSTFGPPHEWFGMKVPGCRGPGTGENVDNNCVFIPVDGRSHFELHGKRGNPPTGDCPIHLTTNLGASQNVDFIGVRETKFNPDGSYVITISPEPANGRPNHLQTTLDTRYVFIRDGRMDWRQQPSALRIHRITPPTAPPLSHDQIVALGARYIIDDVGPSASWRQLVAHQEINTVVTAQPSTTFGGQFSQRLGRAHLRLDDDEAFVMTMSPGGAAYHIVVVNNFWLMSLDYWNNTSTLNNTQSVPNADGSYTYVISNRDPGVHNWIDTTGLHETLIVVRWQLLPKNPDGSYGGTPWTRGRKIKLDDLEAELPEGMKRITAEGRKQQLAERLAAFKQRYIDH